MEILEKNKIELPFVSYFFYLPLFFSVFLKWKHTFFPAHCSSLTDFFPRSSSLAFSHLSVSWTCATAATPMQSLTPSTRTPFTSPEPLWPPLPPRASLWATATYQSTLRSGAGAEGHVQLKNTACSCSLFTVIDAVEPMKCQHTCLWLKYFLCLMS